MAISPILPIYSPIDINFSHGEGVYLYDTNGKRYIDFQSGIAANSLGHCHPHLVSTLKKQSEKVWHLSNINIIPAAVEFAKKLIANSFADTAFFTNSGTEAVECGLKIARSYQNGKGNHHRYKIITFKGAFHGRSFAACSGNDPENFSDLLRPYVEWFENVEPNIESVKSVIDNNIGVVLIEPIQGESGVNVIDHSFLRGLRELCNENDILLFFDCVQCGAGRTGKLFAYEHFGVLPDICALAKGIGGGFPLGACLTTENAAQYMGVGLHGSTYGGNPLATSIGNAVLDELLKDGFLKSVEDKGKYLKDKLQQLANKHKIIQEIRGLGLMLGVKINTDNKEFSRELCYRGLLTVGTTAQQVVRILPPLIITKEQIDEGIGILDTYLNEIAN